MKDKIIDDPLLDEEEVKVKWWEVTLITYGIASILIVTFLILGLIFGWITISNESDKDYEILALVAPTGIEKRMLADIKDLKEEIHGTDTILTNFNCGWEQFEEDGCAESIRRNAINTFIYMGLNQKVDLLIEYFDLEYYKTTKTTEEGFKRK